MPLPAQRPPVPFELVASPQHIPGISPIPSAFTMIARTQNVNTASCRTPCGSPARRYRRTNQNITCSQVKRILQKHRTGLRVPLAPMCNLAQPTDTKPTPIAQLRLPSSLPRPAPREVNVKALTAAYPHLAGVTPQYIRDKLPLAGSRYVIRPLSYGVK